MSNSNYDVDMDPNFIPATPKPSDTNPYDNSSSGSTSISSSHNLGPSPISYQNNYGQQPNMMGPGYAHNNFHQMPGQMMGPGPGQGHGQNQNQNMCQGQVHVQSQGHSQNQIPQKQFQGHPQGTSPGPGQLPSQGHINMIPNTTNQHNQAILAGGPNSRHPNNNQLLNPHNGTLRNPSGESHAPTYAPAKASVISEMVIRNLVNQLTDGQVDIAKDGVCDVLINLANDITDRAIIGCLELANHRGSEVIDLKDVKMYFSQEYDGMRLDGFSQNKNTNNDGHNQHQNTEQDSNDLFDRVVPSLSRRSFVTDAHKARTELIKRASGSHK